MQVSAWHFQQAVNDLASLALASGHRPEDEPVSEELVAFGYDERPDQAVSLLATTLMDAMSGGTGFGSADQGWGGLNELIQGLPRPQKAAICKAYEILVAKHFAFLSNPPEESDLRV